MKKTLVEIAALIDGELIGENREVTGVTNIMEATVNDITFAVPPHLEKVGECHAAAVIVPQTVTDFPLTHIKVENPRVAFTKLLEVFTPPIEIERTIHPTTVIGKNVRIGTNIAIMPYVVLADNVEIGNNTIIYPHTYIGHNVKIGENTLVYPNVTIRENCKIGNNVIIHSATSIGTDGFGFITVQGKHQKVPQVGNVIIEDGVEIGSSVNIDRATTGSTIVKSGTKIDNLVHLAHNVVIGENCFLVAQTGIAGSTKVGNNVTFAGQSGASGHIKIGDNCVFAARSAPISDVKEGSFYAGFPARPHKEWLKTEAAAAKVPELLKRVRELEKKLQNSGKN